MSTPAPEAPAPAAPSGPTDGAPPASETAPGAGAPGGTESQPETPSLASVPEVLTDGREVRAAADAAASSGTQVIEATPAESAEAPKATRTDNAKAGQQAVADLPEWAQRIIKDTRDEAAKTRIDAKAHAEKVAEAARQALTQDIGKALGLISDDPASAEEPAPTPEELLGQLTAERESTRMARVELAVYKSAAANSADPIALLDSRAFLEAVKSIDPADAETLGAAIREAVESNPRLKLEEIVPAAIEPEPTPPPSGGSFAGGPSGRGNDVNAMSIDEFRKAYTASRRR